MTNFYGFDWQNMPSYSRLFSQPVVNRAQSAFTQGMGQFRQYDPSQLEALRQQRLAALSARQATPAPQINSNFYVGPDGRVYDVKSDDFLSNYGQNNRNISNEYFNSGTIGRLRHGLDKGMDISTFGFKPLGK